MLEDSIAKLIWRETRRKHYVMFMDVLFEFVSGHSQLKPSEKLIWFTIFRKSIKEKGFWCRLTHQQIGLLVGGIKSDSVYRAIKNLKKLEFLKSHYDSSSQICSYSVSLPREGINLVQLAPNRAGTYPTLKDLKTEDINCTPSFSDVDHEHLKKYPYLLIDNTGPVKRTSKMCLEESSNSILIDKFEKLQKENSHLSLCERIKMINSALSPKEREVIHQIIMDKTQLQEINVKHTEKDGGANSFLKNQSKDMKNSVESKMILFEFGSEKYWIAESVKNKVLSEIPLLVKKNKIVGSAGKKPINELISEIIYYISKSGSYDKEPIDQLKRFYIARKICLSGNWETPNGIQAQISQKYEQAWSIEKSLENVNAIETLRLIGHS